MVPYMERRKRTAIVLLATTLPGVAAAEVRDHLVPRDDVADIAGRRADQRTAIYQVADLGFVTLDSRTPIEVRQERRAHYRGGAVTSEYGQASAKG
jgi:hypothetical protein